VSTEKKNQKPGLGIVPKNHTDRKRNRRKGQGSGGRRTTKGKGSRFAERKHTMGRVNLRKLQEILGHVKLAEKKNLKKKNKERDLSRTDPKTGRGVRGKAGRESPQDTR